ncbi:hypothetical protein [Ekhidna sp.]
MTKRKKYFKFYLFAIVAWILLGLIFLGLSWYSESSGTETSRSISGIIFVFGICGLPIIIFFSLFVQLAEYIIDRIPSKNNN